MSRIKVVYMDTVKRSAYVYSNMGRERKVKKLTYVNKLHAIYFYRPRDYGNGLIGCVISFLFKNKMSFFKGCW